jgi:hypothetical protein
MGLQTLTGRNDAPQSGQRILQVDERGKPPKQSYAFGLSNGNLYVFAGIWDAWKGQAGPLAPIDRHHDVDERTDGAIHLEARHFALADYDRWLVRSGLIVGKNETVADGA